MTHMYINPYSSLSESGGKWLKANFHTHAGTGEGTCGAYAVNDVAALYKEAGYDVLAISNHDYFIDTCEFSSLHNMAMFNGFEYSQDRHMLCIDVKNVIYGAHQEVIDECIKQGGFVILCHPNWIHKEYWPRQEIDALRRYTGIEIYNSLIFRLNGSGLATDTWDYLLSQGKLVWGFANDDFHRWYDLARTWNMIYSRSICLENIKEAIHNGCFYASTGLILREMSVAGDTIRVSACAKDTYVNQYEYTFIGKDGETLGKQYGEFGKYRIAGNEMYIRVHVNSEHGAMLWTQPVFKKELFKKP